jgi:hypothetical protein
MTHALMAGGEEHFGWGVDRHIAAGTYDAMNVNTRATGQWKKKPPDIKPWPRPNLKPKRAKAVSVRELYARMNPT